MGKRYTRCRGYWWREGFELGLRLCSLGDRDAVLFEDAADFFWGEAGGIVLDEQFVAGVGQTCNEEAINGVKASDLFQIVVIQNAG